MTAKRLVLAALFGGLASCASVSSTGHDTVGEGSVRRSEIAYSLPRTVFNVTAGEGALTVTKGAEPDPEGRFRFHYEPNPFAADDLVAEVSEDGLLKTVTMTATDKTGDIAVNLAETVFALGTGGAALPAGRALPETLPARAGFAASYDPLDPDDVVRTRKPLADAGFCILVGREAHYGPSVCGRGTVVGEIGNPAGRLARQTGVFYRQPKPVPVHIYRRKKAGPWQPVFAGNETLFDKSEVYEVAIDRAAFVEKKVELTFQSGALTKITVNKPSELYALSTVGLTIVKTVIAIPLGALTQDTALETAKAANIEAQTTLLRRQDELLKLQVERQGGTQESLVRSNVDFVEAGGRALGAASGSRSSLEICQSNLAASVADCRAFVDRGSRGF